jgi:hypothetical protein
MLGIAAFFVESHRALTVPEERDYGEGILMWQAMHATHLKAAYHSIDQYPYTVFHYPPVFHLLARAAALLTGNLLAGGRLVSILSFLSVCGVLALIAWRALASCGNRIARILGTLAAGSLGFTSSVIPWACLFRVDLAAALFTITGLALFLDSPGKPRRAFAAFAFFVLALYTKQTMLSAPLVCLLAAWLEDRRMALRLTLFSGVLGSAILLFLNLATGGWFFINLFRYNQNPFTFERLLGAWSFHIQFGFIILLLTGLAAWWTAVASPDLRATPLRRAILISAAYLACTLLMTVTAGKEGASYNYFLEVDLAVSLLSGLFLGVITELGLRRRERYAMALLLALAIFVLQALPNKGALEFTLSRRSLARNDGKLVEFVNATPGLIYGEDMVVLLGAGKPIAAEPTIITSLAKTGIWDQRRFIDCIRNHTFSAIQVSTTLDNHERYTAEVAAAIRAAYPEKRSLGPYTAYLPPATQLASKAVN